MPIMAKALHEALQSVSFPICKVIIALSGGCDSISLLHCAKYASLPYAVEAWHVDHGLQKEALEWEKACQEFCDRHDIPLTVFRLHLSRTKGVSLEALAREARYGVFSNHLSTGEVLLVAHTQEDNSETVLLHLIKGAGPKGLSGISLQRPLGKGILLRPWLLISKEIIVRYAKKHNLLWVEDPSNRVLDFDRNFIRHEIIPLLSQRFPGIQKGITRSALHCKEAEALLHQIAEQDLEDLSCQGHEGLSVESISQLSPFRRNNLLRCWFQKQGLSLPSTKKLAEIARQMLHAKTDRNPCVSWVGGQVRRYKGLIVVDNPTNLCGKLEKPKPILWDYTQDLVLWNGKKLKANRVLGKGISLKMLDRYGSLVEVTVRQGGERCRPFGIGCTRPLKKLLQEQKIPVWERSLFPLIYCQSQLIAVPGIMVQEGWQASELSDVGLEITLDL